MQHLIKSKKNNIEFHQSNLDKMNIPFAQFLFSFEHIYVVYVEQKAMKIINVTQVNIHAIEYFLHFCKIWTIRLQDY